MAYSEELANQLRKAFGGDERVAERKMFGGICFTVSGHMCCGVAKGNLMVRVGPDNYESTLELPGARPMDFTGRPLKGMVYVDPAALKTQRQVQSWVKRGLSFVNGLPPKAPKDETVTKRQAAAKKAATKKAAGKKAAGNGKAATKTSVTTATAKKAAAKKATKKATKKTAKKATKKTAKK